MNLKYLLLVITTIILLCSNIASGNSIFTGLFGASTSVGIIDQVDAVMYEEQKEDVIFQISLNDDGNWYSYNGSFGGIKGGYDDYDNLTQTFILENLGSTNIDVLIASEDFGLNGDYINTDQTNGDLQIYIPGIGWKNIPDNSNTDADGIKDNSELCIANDLKVGNNIAGFDFQVRGNLSGNYTSQLTITAYNNRTANPCTGLGIYVNIGELP